MPSTVSDYAEHMLSRFFCTGINFQKADALTRSLFSLDADASKKLLSEAREKGLKSAIVLSTCNRTEWYGFSGQETDVEGILLAAGKGTREEWNKIGYTMRGRQALQHFFEVAAGLDSQIKGDYEILGQLKKAVSLSRECGMIGPVMDRTVNQVIQASKTIKTNTQLSAGTISVSYAAIEWMKQQTEIQGARILLVGLGKMGSNIARNLCHYFKGATLTVMNRTDQVAKDFASQANTNWLPYDQLPAAIQSSDIVVVCCLSSEYCITRECLGNKEQLTIVDISIPSAVDPALRLLPGIRIADVDEVSLVMKETERMRLEAVPSAMKIIREHCHTLLEWFRTYRHARHLQHLRQQLFMLQAQLHCNTEGPKQELPEKDNENMINNTVHYLARNLRKEHDKGCQFIGAFNHFLVNYEVKAQTSC